LFVFVYIVLCLASYPLGQPFKDRAQSPPILTARTAISTSVCYLDSFIKTACANLVPFTLFPSSPNHPVSDHVPTTLALPLLASSTMSDRDTYYYPSYHGDSSLMLLPSEVCCRISSHFQTGAHLAQPDSFQIGGGQDTQQVFPPSSLMCTYSPIAEQLNSGPQPLFLKTCCLKLSPPRNYPPPPTCSDRDTSMTITFRFSLSRPMLYPLSMLIPALPRRT
jgi:hypothetical protein